MRRGHTYGALLASFAAVAALTGAPTALADDGAPGDICQQASTGLISPNDPIVQGYCGPIVTVTPPVVTVLSPPTTVTPPSTVIPVVVVTPTTPPTSTPATSGVAGVNHTTVAPTPAPTAGVQGRQHTVRTPVASASGPLGTAKATGTLPFTGAQLGLFALVGLALLATGLVLRSTGRPSQRR